LSVRRVANVLPVLNVRIVAIAQSVVNVRQELTAATAMTAVRVKMLARLVLVINPSVHNKPVVPVRQMPLMTYFLL
jgi:hypothetical protein